MVYPSPPNHTVDLAQLPKGLGLSVATEQMAKQAHSVHDEVRQQLEDTNAKYTAAINKHKHHKVFQVGDSVMVFLCKEQFSYQILQKINDNAYIVDLLDSMGISKTFNIANLFQYHAEDVLFYLA